jgi:precorrin-6Y C5,15-methyltransferase (decarboxylating)
MAHDGQVFAIEMDAEDHGLIRQNADRFSVANVNAILGRAPEAFDELPDPDAVFVAGAGREVTNIAKAAYGRLRSRGRLVVNTTSIDHLIELREALGAMPTALRGHAAATTMATPGSSHATPSPTCHIWMINLSRGTDQLDRLSFDPLKPSFLLAVTKS